MMSKMVHHISVKEDAKHVLMLMRILSHEDNGDGDSDDGEEDQAPGSHFSLKASKLSVWKMMQVSIYACR